MTRRCISCGGKLISSTDPVTICIKGCECSVGGIDHLICDTCGEIYYDGDASSMAFRAATAEYKRNNNLLTGREIREIRESLQWSQAYMESVLRVGSKTVIRWEKDQVIQSSSVDSLIRLIDDDFAVRNLLAEYADIKLDSRKTNTTVETCTVKSSSNIVQFPDRSMNHNVDGKISVKITDEVEA